MSAFSKVLIANRGEIAVRVIRAAQAQGYQTVAVYSEADRYAPHVELADEAVCIGPAPVSESYLLSEKILDAARLTGADAVHPGYGFLSENADFSQACETAGIVFIGPSAKAIDLMGNKRAAKDLMMDAKVPCLPGYNSSDQDEALLIAEAQRIGVPLMVKAAAGGGGRGLRLVDHLDHVGAAIRTARSEAESAFGSGELILERAVLNGRHVEIQVFADQHGNVIHLGERDCSVQRRHQKIIEESPSPAVDGVIREKMGQSAVAAARAIGYVGAGTVEFLLDEDGEFYFLEMNTRLQVEHPVTEMVTGLDLVNLQLLVAAGSPLPLNQEAVRFQGHAIEVRLYAEDAYDNFMPQTGRMLSWRAPSGEGVRVDSGIQSGLEVSHYYDPMLAKIITWGSHRDEARRRMLRALAQTEALGLITNKGFLMDILKHPVFISGEATTQFIGRHIEPKETQKKVSRKALALAAVLISDQANTANRGWRSTGTLNWPIKLSCHDQDIAVNLVQKGTAYEVSFDDETLSVQIEGLQGTTVSYLCGGVLRKAAYVFAEEDVLYLDDGEGTVCYQEVSLSKAAEEPEVPADVLSPMNGKVVEIRVKAGDQVEKGQVVAILEAMKIQHELRAGKTGAVTQVLVQEGEQIASKRLMVEVEEEAS